MWPADLVTFTEEILNEKLFITGRAISRMPCGKILILSDEKLMFQKRYFFRNW